MAKTYPTVTARLKRIKRIRKKITGTPDKPRMRVYKSAKHFYAQVIDDTKGHTLVSMSSQDKNISSEDIKGKCALARKVGVLLAEKAKSAGIEKVVLDRGGYIYHGRVKAFSEGAREGGLVF
ncbi:MAG: 50S ribosomal protein L18 [Desulfobulbales bacterium]|nr:50S ribosomal protein L18 [Desulfobulbales bacterium]